jgi:general secretion pathway protein J
MKRSAGFTLVEMLVVVAIFGVFAAMAYGGLSYVLNARKAIEVQLARSAEWQKAFQRLRNDLEFAAPRPARDGFGLSQAAFRYEEFGARIELTRSGWRNPLLLPRASLERIVYRYDADRRELLRETWRVLDRARDEEPVALVVLTGIDEARWRFLDGGRAWRTRWPPQNQAVGAAASTLMPKAIELTLETKDFGEIVWLFRPGVDLAAAVTVPPGDGGTPRECEKNEKPVTGADGKPSCVPKID